MLFPMLTIHHGSAITDESCGASPSVAPGLPDASSPSQDFGGLQSWRSLSDSVLPPSGLAHSGGAAGSGRGLAHVSGSDLKLNGVAHPSDPTPAAGDLREASS